MGPMSCLVGDVPRAGGVFGGVAGGVLLSSGDSGGRGIIPGPALLRRRRTPGECMPAGELFIGSLSSRVGLSNVRDRGTGDCRGEVKEELEVAAAAAGLAACFGGQGAAPAATGFGGRRNEPCAGKMRPLGLETSNAGVGCGVRAMMLSPRMDPALVRPGFASGFALEGELIGKALRLGAAAGAVR